MSGYYCVFDEIRNNPMTELEAKYSKADVLLVWSKLAEQIIRILKDEKGLVIKGLGTFTLSNWSLETGNNNRTLDYWKPVFLLSVSLAEDFDLHQPKQYANDAVPLVPLMYYELAKKCNLTKEQVVGCIEETIQCFRRLVSKCKNVHLPLQPLGNLHIYETNVKFTFGQPRERQIREKELLCSKYLTATAPYNKKFIFPCEGHSKKCF